MMDKKILFILSKSNSFPHSIRFGEYGDLITSCYFRGKELGYSDSNIYLQWFNKIEFSPESDKGIYMKCPSYSILPINFIREEDIKPEKFDKIIDLNSIGAFFDESPKLYEIEYNSIGEIVKVTPNWTGYINYKNKYFLDKNQIPVINIKKDDLNKSYILFHIRLNNIGRNNSRDSNINLFREIVLFIKEKYKDKYEIWKCGEKCRGIDNLCDVVIPYQNEDINKFFKLINNCSLFIGSPSGPLAYTGMFNIPYVILDCPLDGKRPGTWSFYNPNYWKTSKQAIYGDSFLDWADKSRILIIWKNDLNYKEKLLEFSEKWL